MIKLVFTLFLFLLLTSNTFAQNQTDGALPLNNPTKTDDFSLQASPRSNLERLATDLVLFPNEKSLIATIQYYSLTHEYELQYLSQNYSRDEVTENGINLEGIYAFNNNWAFSVKLERVSSRNSRVTYGPASASNGSSLDVKSDGIKDPEFSVVYRAMDVSKNRYDLNLTLMLSPKMKKAEDATVTKKGNVSKGGTDIGVEAKLGQRQGHFSWASGLSLLNNGKAELNNADDGSLTKVSSYTTFSVVGEFQWVLSHKVSLGLNLGLSSTGDYEVTYADNTIYKFDNATVVSVGGTVNVAIAEKVFLVFDLEGMAIGDKNISTSDGDVLVDTEGSAAILNVGIIAQF